MMDYGHLNWEPATMNKAVCLNGAADLSNKLACAVCLFKRVPCLFLFLFDFLMYT